MVETWMLYGAAGLILFFAGLFGGFLAQLVRAKLDDNRLAACEAGLRRLHNAIYSEAGVQARGLKAERQSSAIAEAAAMMQQEGANPKEVAVKIASKYPDVALDVVGKMLKKQGLGSFLGGI